MKKSVSKSQFKPHALEYFRKIEETRQELIITDRGKPVLKVIPYTEDAEHTLLELRNSVIAYENPTEPVGMEDWEALK
jgi:prevent-host-death family protein